MPLRDPARSGKYSRPSRTPSKPKSKRPRVLTRQKSKGSPGEKPRDIEDSEGIFTAPQPGLD
jgi:hypothetical protein